ncbi:MAG: DNA-binding transcriptional ArsR family regulator [Planctomycetota bacterium]|jgi:DNA-binding transcriptional ArsR family regulator
MGFSVKKMKDLQVGKDKSTVVKAETLFTAVMTLRAINNPLRKRIIDLVNANTDITVTKIYKKLKIEQSVASQHLAILRKSGFLTATRNGKFIYYNANVERFAEISKIIEQM